MFKTANEFSLHIEKIVYEKNMPYVDAVLEYCKDNFLDPADIARLVNKSLKSKMELEFQDLNLLPKTAQLADQ